MKLTIGLPVFNAEKYIEDAILSIKAQTFKDWECIIIDDGSTDNSLSIIREIVDNRFLVVSDGENKGLVYRLNQIVDLASGKYIARMDSDDVMHPERLTKQIKVLDSNPNIDLVSTLKYSIDLKNYVHGRSYYKSASNIEYEILKSGYFIHASVMSRLNWSQRYRYSDRFLRAEDRQLFISGIKSENSYVIPEPLYYYREIGDINQKKYIESYLGELKVLVKFGVWKIGFLKTVGLLCRLVAKSVFILIVFTFNLQKRLKARHNLNNYESMEATVYLSKFLNDERHRTDFTIPEYR